MDRKERLINLLVYIQEHKNNFNMLFAKLNEEIFTEELLINDLESNQYLVSLNQTKENSASRFQNAIRNFSIVRSGYLDSFVR